MKTESLNKKNSQLVLVFNGMLVFLLFSLLVVYMLYYKKNVMNIDKANLNDKFTLSIGQKVKVNDELNVKLKNITDSICSGEYVCIWQGEYNPVLIINDVEYIFGSVLTKELNIKNTSYIISYVEKYNSKEASFIIVK